MSTDVTYTIAMLITLTINYITTFIALPRKYGLIVSATVLIAYASMFYIILYLTGNLSNMLGGFRGFVHLPIIILLFRGLFFQKLFAALTVMMFTGFQLTLANAIMESFGQPGSSHYNFLSIVIVVGMFAIYMTAIVLFGRRLLQKLFFSGQQAEWALYSSGAMFSYVTMMYANYTFTGAGRVIVLLFTIWSFVIWCFAIINTHEKAQKNYEAEFVRNIISSGKGHYQKMNEMHNTLRIMRHDYKYHLNTISELLNAGDKKETIKYLTDLKKDMDEKELLSFCSNSVINALLASYAERCARLDIKLGVNIAMPENITIPNYEMCIVLGNLLENAVEASVQQNESRKIELVINTQGVHLAVVVKNAFSGELAQNDGWPVSKKKDGGLGLRSVQAVATRHSGELMTEWDGATFSAYVLMKC